MVRRGEALLLKAAKVGNVDLLQRCINRGVNLQAREEGGKTALNLAAEMGHLTCLEMLILAGASAEAGLDIAVCYASRNGHTGCLRCLLHHGGNPNAHDNGNVPALLHAAWSTHPSPDCIHLLLEKGADVDLTLTSPKGRDGTVLELAKPPSHFGQCSSRCRHIVAIMEEYKDLRPRLMHSARFGNVEILKSILERRIYFMTANTKDVNCKTALIHAAEKGQLECMELLLSNWYIEIDAQDNQGMTALMYAVQNNHSSCLDLLLTKDVDVGKKSIHGKNAIDVARERGDEEVASILEQYMKSKTNETTTPLNLMRRRKVAKWTTVSPPTFLVPAAMFVVTILTKKMAHLASNGH